MTGPSPAAKTVVITGAAGGIGRAVALRFAHDHARLALCDLDRSGLDVTADLCRAVGAQVKTIADDLRDEQAPDRIAQATRAAFGRAAVLVNNAGVEFRGDIAAHDPVNWEAVIDINLSAAFRLVRALAEDLVSERGAIVNLGSVAVSGFSGQAAYDASKGGLITLTRSLSVELGPRGVRANAVAPGFIDTEMVRANPDLAHVAGKLTRQLPIPRMGSPEEVANAVAWLSSDRSSYVTGHTLYVDGGWMRR
ncbi:SDR family NAD(P)-dependent oxidoreductase [Brevundimonas diminuta]|uniref:SDR family NAD(P)-dependent oxidoreductase n=1 Tax=Brevundimonas diminuta TaxID=293 RepID=UPI003209480C